MGMPELSSKKKTALCSSHMFPGDRLQQLPNQYHWAVADSLLLQSIAAGQRVQRGAAGTRLTKLVKLFARVRLVYLLLFLVGASELTKLLIRQKHKSSLRAGYLLATSGRQYPAFFFVGFGAGPEEQLFSNYCTERNSAVARIDQLKVESMGQWHGVGVMQGIASLVRSLGAVKQARASLLAEYRPWEGDFLTFAGMRLGYYSYVNAWFKQLKANAPHVVEVCFLAADTAAFAAVDAGLPTRYLQHGLNRHSLVLPGFNRVDALTHDEALHFQRRLPKADVRLTRPKLPPISAQQPPCLLVASVYARQDEMRRILPFLEVAAQLGVAIHVRPHPREDLGFWQTVRLPFDVSMEDRDATFDDALDRLQPALVVSWFSTTLVDALYRGVIPISVSARDDPDIQDMVYPLFKHCLHWPGNQAELINIISKRASYESTLMRLKVGVGIT